MKDLSIMTDINQNLSYALMEQLKEYIKNRLGEEPWVKVHDYSYFKDENREDDIAFHCGLIHNDCVEEAVSRSVEAYNRTQWTQLASCTSTDSPSFYLIKPAVNCKLPARGSFID